VNRLAAKFPARRAGKLKVRPVFASDNGAAYHDELFHHSGPVRGMKRDRHEGGIRPPVIARWPRRIKAGEVSEQVWVLRCHH
jgi:hypothetical protein